MKYILIILSVFFLIQKGFTHSGGTDGRGGHHDRTNGGYHFHHGNRAHQHPNGVCELSPKFRQVINSMDNTFNPVKDDGNWGELLLIGVLGLGIGYFIRNGNNK